METIVEAWLDGYGDFVSVHDDDFQRHYGSNAKTRVKSRL